jgi:hypothetical protein
MIIDTIVYTGFFGYLFVLVYFLYSTIITIQLLRTQKESYDIIYSIMQLSYFIYIIVFFFRIRISNVFVGVETIPYFKLNFGVLCLLLAFILLYSFIELKFEKREDA